MHGRQSNSWQSTIVNHVGPEPNALDARIGQLAGQVVDLGTRAQQDADVGQLCPVRRECKRPVRQCLDLFLLAGVAEPATDSCEPFHIAGNCD